MEEGEGKLYVVVIPEGQGPGDLLLITEEATGLDYNVEIPEGYAEGDELHVELGEEVDDEQPLGSLTLSPTKASAAAAAPEPGTPERSPAEEATPPSPEPHRPSPAAGAGAAAASAEDLLHLSPQRPPTRPPPARPSPSASDGGQEVAGQSRRSPLRASPIPHGSPRRGSPVQCSPTAPSSRSPALPQTPQPLAKSPAGTEEATPPLPGGSPPPNGRGSVAEASAPVSSKRSPPGRPPPRPLPGAVGGDAGSPNTPSKRSPPVPTTPRPFKTPDGTPEPFEEATPPKQSEPGGKVNEAAPEADTLRLSAAEDPAASASSSPAESPKRRPSRPPPVPDAARRASGQATPSPARAGVGPAMTCSTTSTSSQSSMGVGTMGSTLSGPSPNMPRVPPRSPEVLKKMQMRQQSKPDTDSDRPSSPAMSSISEAASGASSSGSRGRSDSLATESEPEPEPEPRTRGQPSSVASELVASWPPLSENALAQAKAKAAAEAEAKASLREFWIPFNEIRFGAPIDSGAFGTVYRGNYLGPVAVKSIRRHADSNGSVPASCQDGNGSLAIANAELEDAEAQKLLLSGQTRLVEEIRAQTRFHHQNIVQFLGLASGRPPHCPSGLHWLVVTELCDQNLYQVLHNGRDLPWGTRFKLGLDIAQGMTYLHEKQHMAHLDLKSPNVLLKGKDAKLADFGSLRRLRARPRIPRRRPPAKRAAAARPSGGDDGAAAAAATGVDGSSQSHEQREEDAPDGTVRLLSFGGVGGMSDEQAAAMARVHAAVGAGSGGGENGDAVLASAATAAAGVEVAVAEMQLQLGLSEQTARQVATSLNSTRNSLLLLESDGTGGYGTYDGAGGSYAEQEGGIGTPEWLAPELLAVEAPGTPGRAASTRGVDWQAADRYSYGVILWELLTRQRPYEGYKGAPAVAKIGPTIVPVWAYEGERPAWPGGSATPNEWRELCDRCWDGIPTQRPPFKEIADSLREMYALSKAWPHPDKVQAADEASTDEDKERAAAAAAERAERCAAQDRPQPQVVAADAPADSSGAGDDDGGVPEKAQ